jgi:hypothetical protein
MRFLGVLLAHAVLSTGWSVLGACQDQSYLIVAMSLSSSTSMARVVSGDWPVQS